MKKTFIAVIIFSFFIVSQVEACPACVDSGLFYFYPFLGYWYFLLFFWLLGRLFLNYEARRNDVLLPKVFIGYWLFLFFLTFFLLVPGPVSLLFVLLILPSWIISYVRSYIKVKKQQKENSFCKKFISFQKISLMLFVLLIPLSYIIPRKVPHNVRVGVDKNELRRASDDIGDQFLPAESFQDTEILNVE